MSCSIDGTRGTSLSDYLSWRLLRLVVVQAAPASPETEALFSSPHFPMPLHPSLSAMTSSPSCACTSVNPEWIMWHERLGHLGPQEIERLIREGLVQGLPPETPSLI